MSEASAFDPRHPVSRLVADLHAGLDEAVDAPLWSMPAGEAAEALRELTRLQARVEELALRVARQVEVLEVPDRAGATSTAAWWAHATRLTRAEAHRRMRLAGALESRPGVRAALARGVVLPDQALVIAEGVDAVPAEHADSAEELLLGFAADHDAKALRVLAGRILEYVDPAAAEAHEAALLARAERRARAATRFTMSGDGQGRVHGRFTLPALQAAMLRKALLAIAAPRHRAAVEGSSLAGARPERRPGPERLGQAFAELIESLDPATLPKAGGLNATVVVTMSEETLRGGLAAAGILDTGERVSAGEARRLACRAGIIPAVLGGASQVLDLGRRRRFHTEAQRIALALQQGGCTAEGCDTPPGLCHAHHDIPWSAGGRTDLRTGRLLCPRHHHLAHDPGYRTTRLPTGKVAFTRRT